MIEKVIRGGICHAIHSHAETTNKYIKYYDKNKELPYLINSDVNHLYIWAMSQTSSVGSFEWVEEMFKFNKDFIKETTMKIVIEDIFLKLMFNILKT